MGNAHVSQSALLPITLQQVLKEEHEQPTMLWMRAGRLDQSHCNPPMYYWAKRAGEGLDLRRGAVWYDFKGVGAEGGKLRRVYACVGHFALIILKLNMVVQRTATLSPSLSWTVLSYPTSPPCPACPACPFLRCPVLPCSSSCLALPCPAVPLQEGLG